ncbi:hypothetical protein OKW28_000171 [Paraburkholderia sp. 40]
MLHPGVGRHLSVTSRTAPRLAACLCAKPLRVSSHVPSAGGDLPRCVDLRSALPARHGRTESTSQVLGLAACGPHEFAPSSRGAANEGYESHNFHALRSTPLLAGNEGADSPQPIAPFA